MLNFWGVAMLNDGRFVVTPLKLTNGKVVNLQVISIQNSGLL